MRPPLSSTWEHMRLTLLHWLSTVLSLLDGQFHTRWGERVLIRLIDRWQTELNQLERTLAHLEEERQRLTSQMEAMAIHTAVIYLAGRCQARQEMRFDPADPRDEQLLDACIDTLVKEQLAAMETSEIQSGRYVYTLEPDWPAIQERLASAADEAEPELSDWLREGIRFIDDMIGDTIGPAGHASVS